MNSQARNLLSKLNAKQYEIAQTTELLETVLRPKISFDFAIVFCAGDGFCLLNDSTSEVVSLDISLLKILASDVWTEEAHTSNSI